MAPSCLDYLLLPRILCTGGREGTPITFAPFVQLLPEPCDVFVRMADEASIGTFFLAEARGHLRIRNVVKLVGHSFEQHAAHDLRHVASRTAAPLGFGRMARMRFKFCCIRRVALKTHLVRLVKEFQRSLILAVRRVKVVAVATMCATLLEAFGACLLYTSDAADE